MYLLFMNYNMDSDSATHLNHIKTIAYFFEEKYNDDISNKIKAVIDDNHLDYTINNNGVFINLNVIDKDIIEVIYDIIISNDHTINEHMVNNKELFTNIHTKTIYCENETFTGFPDTIHYTTFDSYLLDLSKVHLTI
jgi:hypothetical protein